MQLCVRTQQVSSVFYTHLQWTTMGPASEGLHVFTRRRKARMGVGYSGTP